jgi:hypothetical protein
VWFADIAVEGFEIKFHLAQMLGLKFIDLESKSDKAVESAMKE